jgi:hypothetical protein
MARTRTTRQGNGAGYGGPAKGADPDRKPKTDFGPDTNAAGHSKATPETRAALRREQAEQMKDMLHQLALSGESESARVQAATAFLNRVEGMPVAKQEHTIKVDPNDLSDEALAAIISSEAGAGA